MGQPRGDAQHNRNAVFFTQVKAIMNHIVGFLLIAGFQDGNQCKLAVKP